MVEITRRDFIWVIVRGRVTIAVFALLLLPSLFVIHARAQTVTVLHSFTGKADGAFPYGGVVMDQAGNLYGITSTAGKYKNGTIYKIDPSGKMTILHQLTHHEGNGSYASLLLAKTGNLYGTTYTVGGIRYGTVFELKTSGKFIVLHTFGLGIVDGAHPYAGLIRDGTGNLYGTTADGGATGNGAVFKLDHRTGVESLLYSFGDWPDTQMPLGSLLLDPEGNLYGTTAGNTMTGAQASVFKVDASGMETILYLFTGDSDGQFPMAGLIRDAEGNLYSTTNTGGAYGYGTVFKLDPNGAETVLHSFSTSDGGNPVAGVIRDEAGNLYGTTYQGGLVYKLDPSGNETIL